MTTRKNNTSYSLKKNGLKNIEKKVGFEGLFTDITRRGGLPKEASIYTAEMIEIKIALKEIYKREDKIWVISSDTQSYMQSIE